jgi:hypothetical protein
MPCRISKSSNLLHHRVDIFMAHGVDPLVKIGGQQIPNNVKERRHPCSSPILVLINQKNHVPFVNKPLLSTKDL